LVIPDFSTKEFTCYRENVLKETKISNVTVSNINAYSNIREPIIGSEQ